MRWIIAALVASFLGGCGGCFEPPREMGGEVPGDEAQPAKRLPYRVFKEKAQATKSPKILMKKENPRKSSNLPPPKLKD